VARRVWTVAAAALALGLATAASADRHPGERSHGFRIERVLERHAERLDLDDATREAIRTRAREGRDASEADRRALRALQRELHELLSQDAPDEARVLEKADEIGRVETALQKQRLRTMLAIRAVLTPEQRRELVRIHDEMRADREERRGRWRWLRGAE